MDIGPSLFVRVPGIYIPRSWIKTLHQSYILKLCGVWIYIPRKLHPQIMWCMDLHPKEVTSSNYVVCGLTFQGAGLRHSTRVTSSNYVVCGFTSQGAGLRHPDHDSVGVGLTLLGRVPAKTVKWRKCRSLLLILLPPPGTLRPSQDGPSSGHLFDLSADRWMPCV